MKTIIAGSRSINSRAAIWDAVSHYCLSTNCDITEVVSGDADGADALGRAWAFENCVPVKHFPVTKDDWQRLGKKAGPLRNERMAQYAEAAIVVWDGTSPGSADMIRRAKRHKLKLYVHRV